MLHKPPCFRAPCYFLLLTGMLFGTPIFLFAQSKKETFKNLLSENFTSQWTYWTKENISLTETDNAYVCSFSGKQPVLYLSGHPEGGLLSTDIFENFHLKMEYKWANKDKEKANDSGILYFVHPDKINPTDVWPTAQEFQLQDQNSGDYWPFGTAEATILARFDTLEWIYSYAPYDGNPLIFPTLFPDSVPARRCAARTDAEYEAGEWNTLELICYKGRCAHLLNGQKVMQLEDSNFRENERLKSLHKGHIMLQAQLSPIYFRKMYIRELHHLPKEIFSE